MRARVCDDSVAVLRRLQNVAPTEFLFHVDLTDSSRCPVDRPRLCDTLTRLGWRVLNEHVTDISKRFVQTACSRAGLNVTAAPQYGDPDEVLIIKTNRNYGGIPEASISELARTSLRICSERVRYQPDHGYVVCARSAVPLSVWTSPSLVVERYVNNERNLFYRAYILNDRVALSEGEEPALIKTIGRARRHRLALFSISKESEFEGTLDPDLIPAARAIVRFVAAVRLDYGCLDLLRDEGGKFYAVDVNPTPHWGGEDEWRIPSFLASGRQAEPDAFE